MKARYRFVTRDGWEKWLELGPNPPPAWKVSDPVEIPFPARSDARLGGTLKVRLFVAQQWDVRPYPRELVYVEDGVSLPDSDRFGPDVPSLHRENQYAEALCLIRSIVKRDDPASPLGQAISAMGKVEDIENELRRLPSWLFKDAEP